jgi:hypothetical protein
MLYSSLKGGLIHLQFTDYTCTQIHQIFQEEEVPEIRPGFEKPFPEFRSKVVKIGDRRHGCELALSMPAGNTALSHFCMLRSVAWRVTFVHVHEA